MDFDSLTWVVAEGDSDGRPLFIRLREFPKEFPTSKYPKRLTNIPQEKERYPIKIERYDDPDWSYFEG